MLLNQQMQCKLIVVNQAILAFFIGFKRSPIGFFCIKHKKTNTPFYMSIHSITDILIVVLFLKLIIGHYYLLVIPGYEKSTTVP